MHPGVDIVRATRVSRMSQIRSLDEESGRDIVCTLLGAEDPDGRAVGRRLGCCGYAETAALLMYANRCHQ